MGRAACLYGIFMRFDRMDVSKVGIYNIQNAQQHARTRTREAPLEAAAHLAGDLEAAGPLRRYKGLGPLREALHLQRRLHLGGLFWMDKRGSNETTMTHTCFTRPAATTQNHKTNNTHHPP